MQEPFFFLACALRMTEALGLGFFFLYISDFTDTLMFSNISLSFSSHCLGLNQHRALS